MSLQKVLWVTFCTADTYAASGMYLVRSFLENTVPGQLLVCLEGKPPDTVLFQRGMEQNRVRGYDMTQDGLLKDWEARNQDVLTQQDVAYHVRRIAALGQALYLSEGPNGYDAIMLLDPDCQFIVGFQMRLLQSWFDYGKVDMVYLKGNRLVPDPCILGFSIGPVPCATRPEGVRPGNILLDWLGDTYIDNKYRQLPRWDLAAVLNEGLAACPEARRADLAWRSDSAGQALPYSEIGCYIAHEPGHGGRRPKRR